MAGIAIVYHSQTGNTRKMAAFAREGCERVSGVTAQCMSIKISGGTTVS